VDTSKLTAALRRGSLEERRFAHVHHRWAGRGSHPRPDHESVCCVGASRRVRQVSPGRGFGERQPDPDVEAARLVRQERQLAARGLDHLATDRQPQPGAGHVLLPPPTPEPFYRQLPVGLVQPTAVIADVEIDRFLLPLRAGDPVVRWYDDPAEEAAA